MHYNYYYYSLCACALVIRIPDAHAQNKLACNERDGWGPRAIRERIEVDHEAH